MDSVSLFTLILVGQSELRRTLRKNKFEPVAQRIQLRFHLTGLTEEESAAYIRHQMKTAAMTSPLFSDSALQLIYSATQGIPRLINHICTYALYDAQQRNQPPIKRGLVISFISTDQIRINTSREYELQTPRLNILSLLISS